MLVDVLYKPQLAFVNSLSRLYAECDIVQIPDSWNITIGLRRSSFAAPLIENPSGHHGVR